MAKVCIKTSSGRTYCGTPVKTSLGDVSGPVARCKAWKVTTSGNVRCSSYGSKPYGGPGANPGQRGGSHLSPGETIPPSWIPAGRKTDKPYTYRGYGYESKPRAKKAPAKSRRRKAA